MQLLLLAIGLLLVTVAWNSSKRIGAFVVILVVLGAWLTATKKGIL
jgi:hypothetical protein